MFKAWYSHICTQLVSVRSERDAIGRANIITPLPTLKPYLWFFFHVRFPYVCIMYKQIPLWLPADSFRANVSVLHVWASFWCQRDDAISEETSSVCLQYVPELTWVNISHKTLFKTCLLRGHFFLFVHYNIFCPWGPLKKLLLNLPCHASMLTEMGSDPCLVLIFGCPLG